MRPRHDVRNYEFMPEMVYSKAAESFSASSLLPGGITNQGLVAGVVPRGSEPYPYGLGEEETLRAGAELVNPFAEIEADDLERGRRMYSIYCSVCHDDRGDGVGPAVMRGMLGPPTLKSDRALTLTDGSLFHILTQGQGNMASYAAQLSDADDRWRVVRWIRQLQGGDQ